jgi:hypothetical protein
MKSCSATRGATKTQETGLTLIASRKAKSIYQVFFALWEPDPDIPIMKEAKAEYAKLQ